MHCLISTLDGSKLLASLPASSAPRKKSTWHPFKMRLSELEYRFEDTGEEKIPAPSGNEHRPSSCWSSSKTELLIKIDTTFAITSGTYLSRIRRYCFTDDVFERLTLYFDFQSRSCIRFQIWEIADRSEIKAIVTWRGTSLRAPTPYVLTVTYQTYWSASQNTIR